MNFKVIFCMFMNFALCGSESVQRVKEILSQRDMTFYCLSAAEAANNHFAFFEGSENRRCELQELRNKLTNEIDVYLPLFRRITEESSQRYGCLALDYSLDKNLRYVDIVLEDINLKLFNISEEMKKISDSYKNKKS